MASRHGTAPVNRHGTFSRAVAAIAAVVSVICLVGFGYGWYEYRSLNNGLQRVHLSSLGGGGAGTATGSGTPEVVGTAQNILITGLDSRAGLTPAEQRLLKVGSDDSLSTDTIMIIHVPANGRSAELISLPRDAYVDVPGYLKNKLNAAYADGYTYGGGTTTAQRSATGANLLVSTVEKLTGLSINHYVQVGFGGFYTITKAVGNIPVNLCESTDDTESYDQAHGEGDVGSGFVMSAGEHELTPLQAFEFVRQRHNLVGGDLAREVRQRYFLTTAFQKIESAGVLLDPAKLHNLIAAVDGALQVDDGLNLQTLADQMVNLSGNRIAGYTVPTEGSENVTIAGALENVEIVDPAKVAAFVNKVINPPAHPSGPSSSATPSTGTSSAPHPSSSASTPATPACIH